jgi:hypothetical protein
VWLLSRYFNWMWIIEVGGEWVWVVLVLVHDGLDKLCDGEVQFL